MNQQEKRTSFLVQLTGLSETIVNSASSTFYQQIRRIGLAMLFTAFVGGTMLAYSIGIYYHSKVAVIVAFFLSALFTILLDGKFISTLGKPGFWGVFLRSIPIVAWIIIHTSMLETVLFEDDLTTHLEQTQVPQRDSLKASYALNTQKLKGEIDSLGYLQQTNTQKVLADKERLALETEGRSLTKDKGYGEIAQTLERIAQDNEAVLDSENDRLEQEKNVILEHQEQLRIDYLSDLKALPVLTKMGPLKRTSLLHDMIWSPGNYPIKAYSLAILLLVTMIELLPIIGKWHADFSEYERLHLEEQNNKLARAKMETRIEEEVRAVEIVRQANLKKSKIREHARKEEIALRLQQVTERFRQQAATFQDLAAEAKVFEKGLDRAFVDMLNNAAQQAKDEIKEVLSAY